MLPLDGAQVIAISPFRIAGIGKGAGSLGYPIANLTNGAHPLDPEKPIPHSLGDGGMWTTAADFTRWITAINAELFGARELMMTKPTFNDGASLDHAWGIAVSSENGVEVCSHGGGWYGSVSKSSWIPSLKAGFIAFTVTGGDALDALSANLRKRLTAS